MKAQKTLFSPLTALALISATAAFAQSPPNNDDFAHSTPLTGSSITFTGTLVGATFEPAETNSTFPANYSSSGRSVWWTWTAPESTAVVIAIRPEFWPNLTNAELMVFSGTSLNALSRANTFPALFSKPPCGYARFDATARTSYQIRVAAVGTSGGVGGPFTLQLTATNPPLFIAQPQSYSVSPYGSAFFSAIATGPEPRITSYPRGRTTTSYQWLFNGIPLPGETYPSLLVHGVTTNQAGTYSVIASNIGGITQSDAATLTVVDTNPVPRLEVLPPNNSSLRFNLTGEPARWYKVESSTNLHDWINPIWLQLTNTSTVVAIPRLGPNHFVRASLDVPTDVCVAQLKQLTWSVRLFAMDNRKQPSDIYSFPDLFVYTPMASNGLLFPCPEGGYYIPCCTVSDHPTCSLESRGHVISDTP
jgi:hypothetical protein